jgi:hypothetical protein
VDGEQEGLKARGRSFIGIDLKRGACGRREVRRGERKSPPSFVWSYRFIIKDAVFRGSGKP